MDSNPPPDEPIERPLTFFSASIWTLVAMMVTVLCIAITESGREGSPIDPVSRTGCLLLSYSVVLFGILRLHEPQASIRHMLAVRSASPLVLLLAIVLGAALTLPSDWLDSVLATRFPTPQEDLDATEAVLAVTTIGKKVALFATLGVIQPALQELFFRGMLFTPLRKSRRAETVILAVVAFETLSNLSGGREAVALLAATLVFSWLRGVTGSIFPSLLARVSFCCVGIVPIVLGKPELEPTRPLLAASAIGAVVGLFGISVLARGGTAVLARQRDTEGTGEVTP